MARTTKVISHLLFADDCLLFVRMNSCEAERVMTILSENEADSEKVANLNKFEVSFTRNVNEDDKEAIQVRLDMNFVGSHAKYLGLSMVLGRSKREIFLLVIERVWKKRVEIEVSFKGGKRSFN